MRRGASQGLAYLELVELREVTKGLVASAHTEDRNTSVPIIQVQCPDRSVQLILLPTPP
jgi:hypothetical protein